MPPLPRLTIGALDDLARQLRFAPPEAARRQMERAEELLTSINPEQAYPEDWVVFAITAYRPQIDSPGLIVGRALVTDLCVLIERLSAAAGVQESELLETGKAGRWIDAAALCERWKISRKTLDRYRRRGLPARRVRAANGKDKLFFSMRFVDVFEARHAEILRGAASFSRMDPELEAKLLRMAVKYRQRLGWSLNQTAQRLAERYGRGHETIRQLLRRHNDEPSRPGQGIGPAAPAGDPSPSPAAPLFTERGPLTNRERRVVVRAYARGVSVERLADHFERTRPAIYRVLIARRADDLRGMALFDPETAGANPTATPPTKQGAAALGAASVTGGLGRVAPATLAEMLAEAEAEPVPDPRAEKERALAYWALRAEAARLVAGLPRHNAGSGACDEIETRLRWASRLKAELVRSQLPAIFKTVRANLGRDITAIPSRAASGLLVVCIESIVGAVEQFDPAKGGRVAAPVGFALNRAVSRWAKGEGAEGSLMAPASSTRAAPMLDPLRVAVMDWTRGVDVWQRGLEPDPRVRPQVHRVDQRGADFLRARFGWAGAPPRTIVQLAGDFKMTVHHAAALERDAIVEALRAARAGAGGPGS